MPTELIGLITRFVVEGEEKVVRANRDVARTTNKVTKAMQGATQASEDLTFKQITQASEAARLAGVTIKTSEDLRKFARSQAKAATETKKTTGVTRRQKIEMALLNQVVQEGVQLLKSIARELTQTAVELFENTDEGERLAGAWDTLKDSVVLAIVPFEDTKQLLNEVAISVEELAGDILDLSSDLEGFAAVSESIKSENALADAYTESAEAALRNIPIIGLFADSIIGSMQRSAAATGLFGDKLADSTEKAFALAKSARDLQNQAGLLDEAAESARDYSREIESLAKLLRSAASAQAEFNERQGEITRGAEFDRVQAATDRFVGLAEVESDLQDEIQDINRDANRAVERAEAQHETSLNRIAARGADVRKKLRAQNRLREQFDERRFDLSTLQNERLYLFERQRLAAEGDSLAIDELDKRREIERLVEQENFDLQQQRQKALFELQLKFQKQAAREQARILTAALDEQLRTIEAGRQERVTEAESAAQEEQMQVKGEFTLAIAAIDAQEQEKLLALEKGWNERQAKEAENLAEFIRKNDVAAVNVLAAWHRLYGPDGTFDALVLNAMRRAAAYTAIATAAITGVGNITTTGGRVIPTRYRAHGGDEIVSSPTHFIAGEAGAERVITQPLSSIGGAMTVRWQGGAIPVEGRGQLEGMNTDAIGQAMAQGLVSSIEQAFLRQRGNWGR